MESVPLKDGAEENHPQLAAVDETVHQRLAAMAGSSRVGVGDPQSSRLASDWISHLEISREIPATEGTANEEAETEWETLPAVRIAHVRHQALDSSFAVTRSVLQIVFHPPLTAPLPDFLCHLVPQQMAEERARIFDCGNSLATAAVQPGLHECWNCSVPVRVPQRTLCSLS